MIDKDFPFFKEKLQEMNEIFRRDLPLTEAMVRHLARICKPFDLATVRQACDDWIDAGDFFPKPAELKRACERYGPGGRGTEVTRIRCAFIDASKPRFPDDEHERHWRCPAWFPFDGTQAFCPQHRASAETTHGPPATAEEISAVFAEALDAQPESAFLREVCAERAKRLAAGEHPVQAAIHALTSALGQTMPEACDSREVIEARKQDQLARARAAGWEV